VLPALRRLDGSAEPCVVLLPERLVVLPIEIFAKHLLDALERPLRLAREGNDLTAIFVFRHLGGQFREPRRAVHDDVGETNVSAEVRHGPVDPGRTAQHQELSAVHDELVGNRPIGRVIRFERAKKSQRTRADREVTFSLAGSDDATADDQSDLAVGAQIALCGARLGTDPTLGHDLDREARQGPVPVRR